jgi:hypothetical protein
MTRAGEWWTRLVGSVRPAGIGWTVALLILLQAVTELLAVPALSGSGLPAPVQVVVVLVAGTAARVVLGGFVAWRMLRGGVDEVGDIIRTVVVGVLLGLVLTWVAGWAVVRPLWGPGQWAVELARFVGAGALWLLPCGWGARWVARSDVVLDVR